MYAADKAAALTAVLCSLPEGLTELMCHPAEKGFDFNWANRYMSDRVAEYQALISPKFNGLSKKNKFNCRTLLAETMNRRLQDPMMNKKPSPPIPDFSLSIFFPIYNDWATVASLVAQSIMAAEKLTDDFEVILVDDGSEEKTQKVLTFLESTFSRVRVIHHEKNRGYGGALRTGFRESRKKYIFYTDGDAQYDVTELQNLAAALDETVDIVNGYKIKRNDPIYRVWIGKIYHLVSRFLFNLPIRDVDCDFRLIRRELFDSINFDLGQAVRFVSRWFIKLARNGASFREVPVRHYFAPAEITVFQFKRAFRVARDYAVIWYKMVVLKRSMGMPIGN
jgi:hypothetical protein